MGDKSAQDSIEAQFARRLAGNEKRTRDRALKKLKRFMNLRAVRSDGGFTRIEMLSIWKGMFYCMWMSDKPLVQEELANTMSDLMVGLPNAKTAMLFFDVFLETMQREWRGIDRLRMDKFYLLVRSVLEKGFRFLQDHEWDAGLTDWLLAILKNGPICPTNPMLGMHYHMCDIYLEELAKVSKDTLSAEMMLKFLDPYCIFITKAKNFDLVKSAIDEVFQQLVENSQPALELLAQEDEELVEIRSHTQMESYDSSPITALNVDYRALAERIFELASENGVLSRNRKKAFVLVEKFRELAEGRLPLSDVPDAEYSSEDELAKLQDQLTEEIVSEHTREMEEKQKSKKAMRRKRKAEKGDERGDLVVDEDTETNEERLEGAPQEIEKDVAEDPPKKRRKKKRKAAEAVGDAADNAATVSQDATILEDTSQDEACSGKENESQDASDSKAARKRKKKKERIQEQSNAEIATNSAGPSLDELSRRNLVEIIKDEALSSAPIAQVSPKKKKKRKKAKIIVGSNLSTEQDNDDSAGSTAVELNSSYCQWAKSDLDRKISPQNMPDILQDVVTKSVSYGSDETVASGRKQSFKNLKRWLRTSDEERTRGGADVEKAAAETGVVAKPKLCKKRRNSVDGSPGLDENCEVVKVTGRTPAQKFAAIDRVESLPATSTFVKFSAAKVKKKMKSKHLAATKTKAVKPTAAHTPKRVVFEMSKTRVQCFRKTDKANAVSPSPDAVAFDPRKTPDFGLLKRSRKTVTHGRKSASDFF